MRILKSLLPSLIKSGLVALWETATGWSTPSFALERHLLQRVLPTSRIGGVASRTFNHQVVLLQNRMESSREDTRLWFGPFLGEVGYELLYWRGFVQSIRSEIGLSLDQIAVISRGGVAGWYGVAEENYSDLYQLIGESNLARIQTDAYPMRFDSAHQAVVKAVNGDRRFWVHPRILHQAIAEFKADPSTLPKLANRISHSPILEQEMLRGDSNLRRVWERLQESLPSRYISVKIYKGSNLNDPSFSSHIAIALRQLSQEMPVVALSDTETTSSHSDWDISLPEVIRPMKNVPKSLNLGIQTLIIGRSQAFWGTYGGFSYLPLYLQKASLVFKDGATIQKRAHEVMESHAAATLGTSYKVLNLSEENLVEATRHFLAECIV
jgi:hypothetical protein